MDEEELRATKALNGVGEKKYIELDKLKEFYTNELKLISENDFIDELSVIADLKEFIESEGK